MMHDSPGFLSRSLKRVVIFLVAVAVAFVVAENYRCERLLAKTQDDVRFGESLERNRLYALQLGDMKRRTVDDLITGRITLVDATARCVALDAMWSQNGNRSQIRFPGESEQEREAECLLFLACFGPQSPDDNHEVRERLSIEMANLFPSASRLSVLVQDLPIPQVMKW